MSEIKFKSPVGTKEFKKYWTMFLPDIQDRENLKESHLHQLKILCDLCIEYDELKWILDEHGRTNETEGRNGKQIKSRPEVAEMRKVLVQIKDYSRMLGILLYKDKSKAKGEEEDEFA